LCVWRRAEERAAGPQGRQQPAVGRVRHQPQRKHGDSTDCTRGSTFRRHPPDTACGSTFRRPFTRPISDGSMVNMRCADGVSPTTTTSDAKRRDVISRSRSAAAAAAASTRPHTARVIAVHGPCRSRMRSALRPCTDPIASINGQAMSQSEPSTVVRSASQPARPLARSSCPCTSPAAGRPLGRRYTGRVTDNHASFKFPTRPVYWSITTRAAAICGTCSCRARPV